MLIGFVGDVHGRVFQAIALLATWQMKRQQTLDLIVQCGDMGAYPSPAWSDPSARRYLEADPHEADFAALLQATGRRAGALRQIRRRFTGPVYFVRGNHEDLAWLRHLAVDEESRTAPVDPFNLFCFVPDGTVLSLRDGTRVAFLGGAEEDEPGDGAIDRAAYQSLLTLGSGQIDVLVTHDAPYGIGTGYHGQTQGSHLITALVERSEPRFHVAGHYHVNGPRQYGRTTFLCLSHLVASPIWHPEARGLQDGCLAVLDTARATLAPVDEPWLAELGRPFDFDAWAERSVDSS